MGDGAPEVAERRLGLRCKSTPALRWAITPLLATLRQLLLALAVLSNECEKINDQYSAKMQITLTIFHNAGI